MKTKNRVIKVIAGSLVVVLSLVLGNITVNAQKYLEMELTNCLNPLALATFDNIKSTSDLVDIDKKIKNNKVDFLMEVEVEKALELENWMVDEKVFDLHFAAIDLEEPLELEDWMKNEDYFDGGMVDSLTENEESLEIESWMIDKTIWK